MQKALFCIHLPGFQRRWGGTGDYLFGSIPFRQKRKVMSSAQAGMADEGLRTGNARTGFPLWDTAGPFARRGWQDASSAIPACAEDITWRFWRKGIDPNR